MKKIILSIVILLNVVLVFSQTFNVSYQKVDGKVRAVYTQTSGGSEITVFQSSHPFDVSSQPYLKAARKTSTDWVLASSANPLGFNGVVIEDTDADTFKVVTSGVYSTTSAHGLTVGVTYYLNLNGTIGVERGQYEIPVLKVIDANRFEVLQYSLKQVIEVNLPSEIMSLTPQENNVIRSKGFYDEYDGGASTYVVSKTIPSGLQVDSATVIETANNLYAVLQGVFEGEVKVDQLGYYKDSTSIGYALIARVQRLINRSNIKIIYPFGKYNHDVNPLGQKGQSAFLYTVSADSNIVIKGDGMPQIFIHTDTSQTVQQNFISLTNCKRFTLEGVSFRGYEIDTSFERSNVWIVSLITNVQDVTIRNCRFISCNPATTAGHRLHKYFYFDNNYVEDAPHSVNSPDVAYFRGNVFYNNTYHISRSHAIYTYGSISDVYVQGNEFTRIGGNALKFRAENGVNNIKKNVNFIGNICNDMPDGGGVVDLGTPDSDIAIFNYIISNNVFNNCMNSIKGFNPSGCTITGNVIGNTLDCVLTSVTAIAIAGNNSIRDSRAKNIIISNNTIEDTRNVIYEFTLNDLPIEDDELVVGDHTYVFKASPTNKFHIPIMVTLQAQTEEIADALKRPVGKGGLVGLLAVGAEDIRGDIITYNIILNLTVPTVITTDLDITYTRNGIDYRGTTKGATLSLIAEPSIFSGNIFNNLGISYEVIGCYAPHIKNNIINGHHNVQNVIILQNYQPVFEGNAIYNRFGTSTQAYRVDIRNNFMAVFRNNIGFTALSFANGYYDFFSSSLSIRNAGTGVAENIFWFGNAATPLDSTVFTIESWEEGDQVLLLNGSTTLYTFTYREQGTLGGTEFRTKANLIALIDATSEFVATDPNVNDDGMFKITAASSGTAGNNYKIRTISNCRLCGKYLQENFVGGSANPDVTVFWTTEGTNYNVPTVTPINSGATSLTGVYVDIANSVPGKYYLIKHSNAAGTEKFLIKM